MSTTHSYDRYDMKRTGLVVGEKFLVEKKGESPTFFSLEKGVVSGGEVAVFDSNPTNAEKYDTYGEASDKIKYLLNTYYPLQYSVFEIKKVFVMVEPAVPLGENERGVLGDVETAVSRYNSPFNGKA